MNKIRQFVDEYKGVLTVFTGVIGITASATAVYLNLQSDIMALKSKYDTLQSEHEVLKSKSRASKPFSGIVRLGTIVFVGLNQEATEETKFMPDRTIVSEAKSVKGWWVARRYQKLAKCKNPWTVIVALKSLDLGSKPEFPTKENPTNPRRYTNVHSGVSEESLGNHRVASGAEPKETGFTVFLKTWADTSIQWAEISWLAYCSSLAK